MDENDKKSVLRMIPYGLYVLTGQTEDGRVAAGTVNWVTQVSCKPPLVVVGVKVGSGPHEVIKAAGAFALNVLGTDQQAAAYAFFKSVTPEGQTLGGEPFRAGSTGAPILERAPGYVECSLVDTVEKGDHSVFVGEVVDAGVSQMPAGRLDDATLALRDLGKDIYYGG
ncbi:MAG: flavin reductase [Acidobacteria bacterium]|jgi:flavin reductase (DIM6/NTAB) family NADH-FMN oxidoreductase RutF|nr:flavin reductase [Acidobacteriota bacterium]HJN46806.1 flavin reductase family protein [Vicinamibacterales bacterium]|tara:strand:+ start:8043 stop:8546 length:504 start_codon:yes stop_codon:yes gene_type:complete